MTVWTPSPAVAVKVVGLAWRGGELLLAEVETSDGRVKGVRPIGGSVDFGETREDALAREFDEELGCAIEITGPWHVFENIYEHEGAVGHEIVFAAEIRLGDDALYGRDRFPFLEHDETRCWAAWLAPHRLPAGVELYPSGLEALLAEGRGSA